MFWISLGQVFLVIYGITSHLAVQYLKPGKIMESESDSDLTRDQSTLATLNNKNVTLVTFHKRQSSNAVPTLLIVSEPSKSGSPGKAGGCSQKEEKVSQSYSVGASEVNSMHVSLQVNVLELKTKCTGYRL